MGSDYAANWRRIVDHQTARAFIRQTLNVSYRFTIKERKSRQRHFVRVRGGSASWRETMTTGRVLAASPRSASQISPGRGLIEQVEDLLFGSARARNIKDVVVGEFYNFNNALPGLC